MLCIVLLNEVPSDYSDLAAQLTPDWLASVAASLQTQLRRDIAGYWPYAEGGVVRVGSGPTDLGSAETPARILAELADAPGAVAYHDDENGNPDEFLGLDTCPTLDEVPMALSHEGAEICGDPNCDQWVMVPSGIVLPSGLVAGMQIAREVSDPLQDRSYVIDGIPVSDFVLPPYFDVTLTGPTSYGETIGLPRLEPFQRTAGGYQLARNGDGSGETQVFGMLPPHKQKHPSRRIRRRIG